MIIRRLTGFARLPILLFAGLFFSSFFAGAQTATVRGTVSDENGEPVIGASVVILAQRTGASTNLQGIFSISKLPAGKHQLRVTYVGFDTLFSDFSLEEGKTFTLKLTLLETGTEIGPVEITDNAVGQIRKKEITSGITEISPKQINLLPSLGTPDLAQYLQVLPGVVNTGDQGGQIFVRGGTPIMNMVLMDGAIVYSPFHSIGLFSVFDTDYLRSVDVYSAAFPAQYGGRVSSIMDIRSRNGNFNSHHVKAHINPVTAGFLVEGPLLPKKDKSRPGGVSFLLSTRECHLNKTSPTLYNYVPDSAALPYSFQDIYAKTTFSDGGSYLNLFGFSHNDKVNYEFPANLKWNSWGLGSQFLLLPGNANAIISGNFAYSSYTSGLQSVSENFPRSSSISGFNGGLNFAYILNKVDELSYGVSLLGFKTDYRFTNSFGLISQQTFNNTELAGNVRYKKVFRTYKPNLTQSIDSLYDRLVLEPSLRVHYYNDHSYISIEPRLRMKYNLNRVSLTGAAGLYSQNLMSASSDRDVVNLFQGFLAAPTNLSGQIKSHALQTSAHLLGGVEIEVAKNLETTAEVWVKDFTQLTNINRDKMFPTDPDFITETGIAYGFDLLARYETKHWYLYATYGWMKVTRDNTQQVYPTVFDRRHNVNLVASWKSGKLGPGKKQEGKKPRFEESKWELSGRWAIGSGFPFTQTLGFFEKINFNDNGSQTQYQNQNGSLGILYSPTINGGRLPWFHRLDFSAKRRWTIANKCMIEANISLFNTYNRKNVFYFDRIRFAVVNQLPILPSAGLTFTY